MTDTSSDKDQLASRVATSGIIAGLILTAIGMLASSPVAGAAGFIIIMVLVIGRRPIARLLSRFSGGGAR